MKGVVSMRWSDKQIDRMDRTQVMAALNLSKKVIMNLKIYDAKIKAIDDEISKVESAYNSKISKPFTIFAIIAGIVMYILFRKLSGAAIVAFLMAAIMIGVFYLIDKFTFRKKRILKADEYKNSILPGLLELKQKENDNLNQYCSSDDVFNASLFLPKEYFNENAIDSLLSLLQSRRANSLAEAINTYEIQQHQKRIEEMEQQKVLAAQAAAQAQQRAALAQERSASAQESTAKSMKEAAAAQKLSAQQLANSARTSVVVSQSASQKGSRQQVCHYCGQSISIHAKICPYCQRTATNRRTLSQKYHETFR